MKIIDCVQGSPEWIEARRGTPSASCFDKIITPAKGELSKSADDYACELIAERYFLGELDSKPITEAMFNGTQTEPEARRLYEFDRGVKVEQVGFVTTDDGRFGCSPDGLMPRLGRGLELKCPTGKTHVRWMLDNELPLSHKCQVHGCMAVTGYDEWDFLSYVPGLPTFIMTVVRDDFTAQILDALEAFHARYLEIVSKLQLPEPSAARHEDIDLPACFAM